MGGSESVENCLESGCRRKALLNRCLGLRVERARQGRSRVSEKDCPRSGERSASALRGAKGSLLGTFNPLCAGLVIGSLA